MSSKKRIISVPRKGGFLPLLLPLLGALGAVGSGADSIAKAVNDAKAQHQQQDDEIKCGIFQIDGKATIDIVPNIHTAKVNLSSNKTFNFHIDNSIGSVLGFNKRIFAVNDLHTSDDQVRILKTNAICIDCNIANGSYLNSKSVHIIH